jgi:hypothetical protein
MTPCPFASGTTAADRFSRVPAHKRPSQEFDLSVLILSIGFFAYGLGRCCRLIVGNSIGTERR